MGNNPIPSGVNAATIQPPLVSHNPNNFQGHHGPTQGGQSYNHCNNSNNTPIGRQNQGYTLKQQPQVWSDGPFWCASCGNNPMHNTPECKHNKYCTHCKKTGHTHMECSFAPQDQKGINSHDNQFSLHGIEVNTKEPNISSMSFPAQDQTMVSEPVDISSVACDNFDPFISISTLFNTMEDDQIKYGTMVFTVSPFTVSQ